MEKFTFQFVEEVTSQVSVKAENEAEARQIIEQGEFSNDEVVERKYLEITECLSGN